MQVRKIAAKDNKTALKEAVKLFGDNAVILSSIDTPDGVEIVASDELPETNTSSANYSGLPEFPNEVRNLKSEIASLRSLFEEQLSSLIWDSKKRMQPLQAQVIRHLMKNGYCGEICEQVANDLNTYQDMEIIGFNTIWNKVIAQICNYFTSNFELPQKLSGKFVIHGNSGSGKTSSIVKIVTQHALKYGTEEISFISLDTNRVGRLEELQVFARILEVPLLKANNANEFKLHLDDFRREVLFVDTPANTAKFFLENQISQDLTHLLVIDCSQQLNIIENTIKSYHGLRLSGVILTKVDQCVTLGEAISVLIKYDLLPLFMSNGEAIPDNLLKVNLVHLIRSSLNLGSFTNKEEIESEVARKYSKVYLDANDKL